MPSTRRTEFTPFILDLLDFMEEKLREAIADAPSQAGAVSEATGAMALLRDRLRENEEVMASFMLLFSDYLYGFSMPRTGGLCSRAWAARHSTRKPRTW